MDVVTVSRPAIDQTVVTLAGELDSGAAPRLRNTLSGLIDTGYRHLVLDLSGVTFLDCTALSVLVGALKRLRTVGSKEALVVVCPPGRARRRFEITALVKVFPIYTDLPAALRHHQPDPPSQPHRQAAVGHCRDQSTSP